MKLFRCSGLADLIGNPKGRDEVITTTAKSAIRAMVKEDLYGFRSFKGNPATRKGNQLEDMAIDLSGRSRFRQYKKHEGRVNTDIITGECDILDLKNLEIGDTKCTWDIGSHPFFQDEAKEKVKKSGYDIQLHGYFLAYEEWYLKTFGKEIRFERGFVDFWLFPCPIELTNDWDDREQLIDMVENIPIQERLTTVIIERNDSVINQIKEKIPHCQKYYEQLLRERTNEKT